MLLVTVALDEYRPLESPKKGQGYKMFANAISYHLLGQDQAVVLVLAGQHTRQIGRIG